MFKFGFECEHNTLLGGDRYVFAFENGRGASVIRHDTSYGSEEGLYELAVLNESGDLDYTTPITDDVVGWLDDCEVGTFLRKINKLPKKGPKNENR